MELCTGVTRKPPAFPCSVLRRRLSQSQLQDGCTTSRREEEKGPGAKSDGLIFPTFSLGNKLLSQKLY